MPHLEGMVAGQTDAVVVIISMIQYIVHIARTVSMALWCPSVLITRIPLVLVYSWE